MSDKALTNEELEAHVDKYLSTVQAAASKPQAAAAAGGTAAAIPNVCPAYKMVKPILQAVLLIPFLSKKIKDAIKAFMSVMDAICP
ncbi:MAG TPA: hypothetical protein VGN90_10150 [Pyrinomonadaceae bacterium]|nr:hypothetical protein [Pyrinomonadaceae bacterium]